MTFLTSSIDHLVYFPDTGPGWALGGPRCLRPGIRLTLRWSTPAAKWYEYRYE